MLQGTLSIDPAGKLRKLRLLSTAQADEEKLTVSSPFCLLSCW